MSIVRHNVKHYGDTIAKEAARLDIEAAQLHAVAAVEVGEIAHPAPGLPVIRFEVHAFLRRVGTSQLVELRDAPTAWHADAHWYRTTPDAEWQRVHTGNQVDEWAALYLAQTENDTAALECASYGVGQLMGWHSDVLGYKRVHRMVGSAIGGGVPKQVEQWGAYIERDKDGAMLLALRSFDWETFVRLYNGTGQVPYYTDALVKRYDEAVEVLANPPPPDVDISLDTWRERQQALVDLGYDPGPVDGVNGSKTTAALKQFQGDHGLNPDGWWGPMTEGYMAAALAAA